MTTLPGAHLAPSGVNWLNFFSDEGLARTDCLRS